MSESTTIAVVVPAAGSGVRFGSTTPKQYLPVAGIPIIIRTLQTILSLPNLISVVVALPPSDNLFRTLLNIHKISDVRLHIVVGGESRADTVQAALAHSSIAAANVVLIHDGVRPLASPLLFKRIATAALEHGAAIPGIPITDTIKQIDGKGAVVFTITREDFRAVQTPQGFRRDVIENMRTMKSQGATDEAMIVERNGIAVYVIDGETWNVKVTTEADITIAESLLAWQSQKNHNSFSENNRDPQ